MADDESKYSCVVDRGVKWEWCVHTELVRELAYEQCEYCELVLLRSVAMGFFFQKKKFIYFCVSWFSVVRTSFWGDFKTVY